jgi:hypothetical protein
LKYGLVTRALNFVGSIDTWYGGKLLVGVGVLLPLGDPLPGPEVATFLEHAASSNNMTNTINPCRLPIDVPSLLTGASCRAEGKNIVRECDEGL